MDAAGDFDTDWRRPPPTRRALRNDAVIAGALLLGALLSLVLYNRTGLYDDPAPTWQCIIWAVLVSTPLAWRRRYPLVITIVVGAAFIAGQVLEVPELLFSNITFFLAFYSVGAWSTRRTLAMAARAVIVAVIFVWLFTSLILNAGHSSTLSTVGALSPYLAYGLITIITNLLYFGAAYFFGENAYRAARQKAALETRTAELMAEREHSAEQAVALERLRIARELHDVVAHHVSVMGVQAGAARRVLASDPAAAASALGSIEDSARTAVDELHLLLGALRSDDTVDDPATSTSTRSIDTLDTLVTDATNAGLPTQLITVGEPRPVPSTVGLTAYRIVQEALTNTRKHGGGGATAEVRVRYLEDALELEISDTGSAAVRALSGVERATTDPSTDASTGLGHRGMRERVAAVGGSIRLGPKARGGFLVRASFPLSQAAEQHAATGEVPA